MVKANKLIEMLPIISDHFYGGKIILYIVKANKKSQKHYFEINHDGRILIYPDKEKVNYQDNPTVEGKGVIFDDDTNAPVYVWQEGDKFAKSLTSTEDFSNKTITAAHDGNLIQAGAEYERLRHMREKNPTGGSLPWIAIITIFLIVVCLYFNFQIGQKLGINFLNFGGT